MTGAAVTSPERTLRVAVVTVGTRGDVQPMVALSDGLVARGHAVTFFAPRDFEPTVTSRGLPFVAVGRVMQAWIEELMARGVGRFAQLREISRFLQEDTAAQLAVLDDALPAHDLVVIAGISPGAAAVCVARGLKFLYVFYAPPMVPSDEHAPFLMPVAGLPRLLNRLLWDLGNAHSLKVLRAPVDAHRAALGLAKVSSAAELQPARALCAWDTSLAPVPRVLPSMVEAPSRAFSELCSTGAFILDDERALPAELARFLDGGEPPVYLGFGSMVDADREATLRAARAVAETHGVRLVLGQGWTKADGGDPPPSCVSVDDVPHARLFPRCRAVIHHGGAGTVAAAARAGAPQLVVPHIADQFFWGRRVEFLGLGPRALPRSKLDEARLVRAVGQLLNDEGMTRRARELAAELAHVDGVAEGVRVIEETAREGGFTTTNGSLR